jgi:hypothetical protein
MTSEELMLKEEKDNKVMGDMQRKYENFQAKNMGNFMKLYPRSDMDEQTTETYTRIKEHAHTLFENQFGVRKAKTTPILSSTSKMEAPGIENQLSPDIKRDENLPKFISSGPFTSEPSATTQGSYVQINNQIPNIPAMTMQSMKDGIRISRGSHFTEIDNRRTSSG